MNYILVENKQTILLGPMTWKPRFLQNELIDLEVPFTVPPVGRGYIKIDDTYEIFPVSDATGPAIDTTYEQMVGPFYTFANDTASATYSSMPLDLDIVRGKLKAIAAAERYTRECKGVTVALNGVDYSLPTDRNLSTQFDYMLATLGDGTANWKFDSGFVVLTIADVQAIVNSIKSHIQSQFDWEKSIIDAIDIASTVDALKAIVIVVPAAPRDGQVI